MPYHVRVLIVCYKEDLVSIFLVTQPLSLLLLPGAFHKSIDRALLNLSPPWIALIRSIRLSSWPIMLNCNVLMHLALSRSASRRRWKPLKKHACPLAARRPYTSVTTARTMPKELGWQLRYRPQYLAACEILMESMFPIEERYMHPRRGQCLQIAAPRRRSP